MHSVSRRTFLHTGAVTAASLAAPSALGANERIRVGVIGCRNRGHQVARSMLGSGQFEIAALSDCDTAMMDRAAEAIGRGLPSGTPRDQDFRRTLERDDVDGVIIATPDHWHGPMTILALDAGKHVYVEKPANRYVTEGDAMVAAHARNPHLAAVVGSQQRSGPHFESAKAFIQEGGLGKVGFVRTWITQIRTRLDPKPDVAPPDTMDYELWVGPAAMRPYNENRCHYWWHFVPEYGTGETGNWGAHWLDIARWCLDLDMPSAVLGTGGQYVVPDAKETPDTLTVLFEYPDRTLVWEQRIWTDFDVNREGSGIEFGGEKGTMVLSRGGWTYYPHDGRRVREGGTDQQGPHVQNFADAIRGVAEPNAPLADGCRTATLCHLANMAAVAPGRLVYDAENQVIEGNDAATALLRPDYRSPWKALVPLA